MGTDAPLNALSEPSVTAFFGIAPSPEERGSGASQSRRQRSRAGPRATGSRVQGRTMMLGVAACALPDTLGQPALNLRELDSGKR